MGMYLGGQKISPIIKSEAEINNQDKTITENGTYTADAGYTGLGEVTVNVSGGITPTGTLNITANGVYNVTNYASANVSVSGGERSLYCWEGLEESFYVYTFNEAPVKGDYVIIAPASGYGKPLDLLSISSVGSSYFRAGGVNYSRFSAGDIVLPLIVTR